MTKVSHSEILYSESLWVKHLSCHMKFSFVSILLLLIFPLNAQDSGVEANKTLRTTVQKWISVMKDIQQKKKEWEEKKEILLDSKESLKAETAQLESEISAARDRRKKLDVLSEDKLAEKDTFDNARKALREGLDDLDAKISAVIPLLPDKLKKEGKVEKAITDHQGFVKRTDKDKIPLNARLLPMITILLEAEKFNQVITPFQGLTAQVGDDQVILDGIYFGLAMGFASDEQGKVAYRLNPSSEGWSKEEITDPETVSKIRELIDVGNASGEMRLIDLPLEIAK